jgi:hypothetical protein
MIARLRFALYQDDLAGRGEMRGGRGTGHAGADYDDVKWFHCPARRLPRLVTVAMGWRNFQR